MTHRSYIIIILFLLTLTALLYVYMQLSAQFAGEEERPLGEVVNEPVGQDFGVTPTSPPTQAAGPRREVVEGRDGSSVTVNNVRYLPQTVTFDDEAYKFGDNGLVDGGYALEYYAPDDSYLIVLLSEPLQLARERGEAAFLEALGITEEEACRLKVRVATNIYVNQLVAGQDLGLSFCPGSTAI